MEETDPLYSIYQSIIDQNNERLAAEPTGLLSTATQGRRGSITSGINWDEMEFESAQAKAARVQAEAPKPKSGGCCFIFMEARYGNGSLDAVVRRYRDEYMTATNKRGYYKLSEVLVPLMRKSCLIKALVQLTMTTPLLAYGKAHYRGHGWGLWLRPVKDFWLSVFDYLGQEHAFIRENGEVI